MHYRTSIFALALTCLTSRAQAHNSHAKQPRGIIDPLITHHAVLEDELKLNYFGAGSSEDSTSYHVGSLEFAYAITDLIGVELFVPFGLTVVDGDRRTGLGDLELQLPKLSFVRRHGLVMTTYVAVRAPTGSVRAGLGDPGWTFAPHLLTDLGFGDLGIQINAATELETEGAIALEANLSLAYSFGREGATGVILSPLIELNVEAPVRGEEAGSPTLGLTPGVKLTLGGWHVGAGLQLPISRNAPFDYQALVQVGYHVTWETLFVDSP